MYVCMCKKLIKKDTIYVYVLVGVNILVKNFNVGVYNNYIKDCI